jgi:hypothetical protein
VSRDMVSRDSVSEDDRPPTLPLQMPWEE